MSTVLARNDNPSTDELFATIEEMTMLDATVHSTTALLVYDDLPAAHEYLVRAEPPVRYTETVRAGRITPKSEPETR